MVNFFRLLFCISLLLGLLQGCQTITRLDNNTAQKTPRKKEAAIYNTQLGMAYLKQGDKPRAKRKLLTALDLDPSSANSNAAMAYFLEQTGEADKAIIYYQKALALSPKSGEQLNNYGTFLCREKNYKEAEKYFMLAVKDTRYINTAGAYENAGLCAAAIPNYTQAKTHFINALKQDSQRKQALYELVKIELKQNNSNDALHYLQQYSSLTLNDLNLLNLAIESSHNAGKRKAELFYKTHLARLSNFTDHPGARNEYNNTNG